MKKIFFSCLILLILLIWKSPIWASQDYDFNVKVMVNDTLTNVSDQPPFIYHNRIYISLRAFAELLDVKLAWHKAYHQTVFIHFKEGDVLGLKIGAAEYTWKGQFQALDAPPLLINNRVMIPLNIFAETRIVEAKWKGEIRTVHIKWEDRIRIESTLPNVLPAMQTSQFWTKRMVDADSVLMNQRQISTYNRQILNSLPMVLFDLIDYPASLTKDQLHQIVNQYSFPTGPIFINGKAVEPYYYDRLLRNMNVDDVESLNPIIYAFTVARTNIRSFPSKDVITSSAGELYTDVLQETALGPVEPVLILHWSKDRQWCFIQSRNYAGWVEYGNIAYTRSKDTWQEYLKAPNFLVITGSKVSPSFIPGAPDLTKMQFTMGTKLSLVNQHGTSLEIIGQSGVGNYCVIVPQRKDDGSLIFQKVLIPLSADVHIGYLSYTRRNIIDQAFKLQGQRYGWGGMYESWDCSALVMDVFRCFGVEIPRNTGQQAAIPGKTIDLTGSTREERLKLLEDVSPGSALHLPGHTMIYLGRSEGRDYTLSAVGQVIMPESKGISEHQEKNIFGVVVSDLSLLRKSTGLSWLESLTRAKEYR